MAEASGHGSPGARSRQNPGVRLHGGSVGEAISGQMRPRSRTERAAHFNGRPAPHHVAARVRADAGAGCRGSRGALEGPAGSPAGQRPTADNLATHHKMTSHAVGQAPRVS